MHLQYLSVISAYSLVSDAHSQAVVSGQVVAGSRAQATTAARALSQTATVSASNQQGSDSRAVAHFYHFAATAYHQKFSSNILSVEIRSQVASGVPLMRSQRVCHIIALLLSSAVFQDSLKLLTASQLTMP